MGVRIDALDAVANAQSDHVIPAMRSGQTVKLTAQQLATFIIAIVTDSAPATLDTLNELAAALGDDPNFAASTAAALAARLEKAQNLADLSSKPQAVKNLGVEAVYALAQGRLSLNNGVAVTVSDVTAAGSVHWVPYLGERIWLFSGSLWTSFASGALSLSLSGTTASRPHDIFMDFNGGSPVLVHTAWNSDTVRSVALATQDGVLVKSGAPGQRYLGTIYVNASNQCEDSNARRWVWNFYNRRPRPMRVVEGTDTWSYTTATIRQVNGSTANQLDFVRGLDEDAVSARAMAVAANPTVPCTIRTLIGLNSTTAPASGSLFNLTELQVASRTQTAAAEYSGFPGVGRHFLAWLEQSSATGTTTWYGDNGSTTSVQTGIAGLVWA